MKNLKTTFFIIGFVLLTNILSIKAQTWNLVWSDEFDTAVGPDWVFETGNNNGWGNGELQTYTNGANAKVVNGILEISAQKESNGTVTSTRMKTQGKKSWQYGKVEARIKLPLFHGAFPAFWMLGDAISNGGWPKCGEIDIMENINANQKTYGTIHYDEGGWQHVGSNTACDPSQWHTNTMIWDKNKVTWYLDGVKYNEYDLTNAKFDEFRAKFFILLNLAYKSNWTESEWPGATLANFPATPQVMYVDWVRVYQQEKQCGVDFTALPSKIKADDYCGMSGVTAASTNDLGGGNHIEAIDDNDFMSYSINVPATGEYVFTARVATANGGAIQIEEPSTSTVYGTVNLPSTGAMNVWKDVSQTVNLTAGNHTINIKATTGGFNLNWISFKDINTTIIEAEDYDHDGAGIAFYDISAANEGGQYRTDAVDIEAGGTGFDVGWIANGEWLKYTTPNLEIGTYDVTISTACPTIKVGQAITIKLDGVSIGTVVPTITSDWKSFKVKTISNVVIKTSGQKNLKLEFAVGDYNVDYIKFVRSSNTSLFSKSSNDNSISIYPQPVTDKLNIKSSTGYIDQVDLYSISGVKVLTALNSSVIDMSSIHPGVYLIVIISQGVTVTKRVVKI